MSLKMVRIDDRLIHGQVLVGWCPHLRPDRLVLCDDEVAESEWEREIYQDAAMDFPTSICTVSKMAEMFRGGQFDSEEIFLIVSSPEIVVSLIKAGVQIVDVIVGGMHFEDGKRKITNFIYVNDADLEAFRFLADHNVLIQGKDLPDCKAINLAKVLGLK